MWRTHKRPLSQKRSPAKTTSKPEPCPTELSEVTHDRRTEGKHSLRPPPLETKSAKSVYNPSKETSEPYWPNHILTDDKHETQAGTTSTTDWPNTTAKTQQNQLHHQPKIKGVRRDDSIRSHNLHRKLTRTTGHTISTETMTDTSSTKQTPSAKLEASPKRI